VEGSRTTGRGVELRYELRGSGPPITFVGSFFMPSSGWGVFVRELERRCRILTYDLGPSGRPGSEIPEFDSYVADLDDLLCVAGIESTYLLGHSSGTQICTAYAAAHPDRVRGLILVGPLVNPGGGERRRLLVSSWRDAYVAGGFGGLFDVLWWLVHSEATIARAGRMGRKIMRSRFVEMNEGTDPMPLFALSDTHQVEFDPDWAAITAPALLLTGEDDCVATAATLRETQALLPASETVLLERAGHVAYLEATEAFQAEVRRFVDRVEAGRLRPGAASPGSRARPPRSEHRAPARRR
jgi:3-oxoadipate enol-lactonase